MSEPQLEALKSAHSARFTLLNAKLVHIPTEVRYDTVRGPAKYTCSIFKLLNSYSNSLSGSYELSLSLQSVSK